LRFSHNRPASSPNGQPAAVNNIACAMLASTTAAQCKWIKALTVAAECLAVGSYLGLVLGADGGDNVRARGDQNGKVNQ
jgi:hypothetical protein